MSVAMFRYIYCNTTLPNLDDFVVLHSKVHMAGATACFEIYVGTTAACPSSARDSSASPTLSLCILPEIEFHLLPRKRSVRTSHRARSLPFALTSPLSSTILLRLVTSPRTCQHQTSAREKRTVLQLWTSLLLLPNRRRQRRVSRVHSLMGISTRNYYLYYYPRCYA